MKETLKKSQNEVIDHRHVIEKHLVEITALKKEILSIQDSKKNMLDTKELEILGLKDEISELQGKDSVIDSMEKL